MVGGQKILMKNKWAIDRHRAYFNKLGTLELDCLNEHHKGARKRIEKKTRKN